MMSGYGETKRRRSNSRERGRSAPREEKRPKGKKKEKKNREAEDRSRKRDKRSRSRAREEEVPELTKAETGPEAVLGRKDSHNAAEKTRAAWRQEMEKTAPAAEGESDGEVHGVEDEEDVDRKVQESRARREALMAKWVNRGERNG
ncbi:unnamed protein product, partial [Effrenium voratum]